MTVENHILQVPKNSPKVRISSEKGYLAAAGAAIGGAWLRFWWQRFFQRKRGG